jgi:hypothetical protein
MKWKLNFSLALTYIKLYIYEVKMTPHPTPKNQNAYIPRQKLLQNARTLLE